ncbi:hypothetical protein [Methylobacterium sp. WL120]|uniref:hypothetical protein n=1 Tax=Methylobacterium sp. WL120 TaxID=2603887 RepID=UPI0016506E19|nr:hypothetical protein [Methylobacterium sp. WL120]
MASASEQCRSAKLQNLQANPSLSTEWRKHPEVRLMLSREDLLECVSMQQHAGTCRTVIDRRKAPPACRTNSSCLIPFDRREGITTAEAAQRAARTERTIRMWCRDHDIGRRVAGGPWLVSRVALAMFLNDDAGALRSYLAGDRRGVSVSTYFGAEGLADLIDC